MKLIIENDSMLATELIQQIYCYIDLSSMYETKATVLGFSQHLKESYE